MFVCPHASFRGLGDVPRQLVGRVKDVLAGDKCEIHLGSSDHLVVRFSSSFSGFSSGWFRDISGPVPGVYAGLQLSIPYHCTTCFV